jgi:hypothetical protein
MRVQIAPWTPCPSRWARPPFVRLVCSVRFRGWALDGRNSAGMGSEALNLVFAGSIPARPASTNLACLVTTAAHILGTDVVPVRSWEQAPSGRSSDGRSSACQIEGRGFDPRRPLQALLGQRQSQRVQTACRPGSSPGEGTQGRLAERQGAGLLNRGHDDSRAQVRSLHLPHMDG